MQLDEAIQTLMDAAVIYDYATEYGEPGYSSEGPVIAGDWWCRCHDNPEDTGPNSLHGIEHRYPAEFAALEEAGADLVWYDEWHFDNERDKAWRIQPDSYSWESSLLFSETACEYLTPDDDVSAWIAEVVNDPHKCLPSHVHSDAELAEHGFIERECGFASGWYPGQDDDPVAISDAIRTEFPNADVLFKLSGVGQFDVHFCVYVRLPTTNP